MKRTIPPKEKHTSNIEYDIQAEPIVLSKAVIDKLLTQEKPSDLISLYIFYYYTAKWQKTNQPKATTGYAAKGLKWSTDRIRNRKKTLIHLGLIQDITARNSKNTITGHYIKVNFIWSQTHSVENQYTTKPTLGKNPGCGIDHPVGIFPPNALSSINENALSSNNQMLYKKQLQQNKKITPSQFGEFWKHYPRKTDKGKAKTTWDKLCQSKNGKRPLWVEVRKAIHYQKQSERWQDRQFIPHPTTWLNNQRWLDDPKEMKVSKFKIGSKNKPQTPDCLRAEPGKYDNIPTTKMDPTDFLTLSKGV